MAVTVNPLAARSAALNARYGLGGTKTKPPTKAAPKKPPPRPPASPPPAGDPFGDLVSTASAQARQQIQDEIAALTGQQSSTLASARENARQLALASQAGASLIHGFGTPVADAYNEAAKTLAALGAGYTGDLRSAAAKDAAAVQHDLESVRGGQGFGSVPAVGQAVGPDAINHGDAIANYLYGSGAAQPSSVLGSAAGAAAAREAAIPETLLGHGQDLGVGVLGAAQKAIEAISPQIAAISAKFPQLQSQILASLASAQSKLGRANTPKILGSSSSGYYAFDPATGKMTQILGPAPGSTRVQTFSSGGNEYAINPDGTVQQITHNQPSGPSLKAVRTKNGTALVDPRTGRTVRTIPGTVPSTSSAKAPTPNELNQMVQTFKTGGIVRQTVALPNPDKNGNPIYKTVTKRTGALKFQQAYNRLRALHVSDIDARHLLATVYKRGEQGRGWLTNEEQTVLRSQRGLVPRAHVYKGVGFLDRNQYAALQRLGLHPPGHWVDGGHTSTQDFGTVYVIDQTY